MVGETRLGCPTMADILNFVFLLVCILVLSIKNVIAEGRISELEGKVDSLLIFLKSKAEGNNDEIFNAPTIIEADLEWKMKNCCCFSNTDKAEGGGDEC